MNSCSPVCDLSGVTKLLPLDHVCLTSSYEVTEIAKGLFQATGLNFFSYTKIIPFQGHYTLHTSNPLLQSWLRLQSVIHMSTLSTGGYFWEDIQGEQQIIKNHDLGFGNGVFIVNKYKDYSEIFGFAAPLYATSIKSTFYLNYVDLLNRFSLYFKEKGQHLIKKAADNLIAFSENDVVDIVFHENVQSLQEFKDSLNIKKYYFNDEYNGVKLSKREIQCLTLYLKGRTSSQVAEILNLNQKTIESFLYSIKKKFRCESAGKLFELFWDLGILKTNGWIEVR